MTEEKSTLRIVAKQSVFAVAGLVLAVTSDVAGASPSTRAGGDLVSPSVQQSARLAEATAVTKPKYVKRKSRSSKATHGSGDTWLNPQPEPPMGPAKVNTGGTWLNPQPEPPRPVTRGKKIQ